MDDTSQKRRSIELLQELGLKEYEAKSFVALARRESRTAKEIAETSAVPRTRVYDAVRVLESKGLVEIQHSSPQQFRAVAIDEAVDTLLTEYERRTDALRDALRGLDPVEGDDASTDVTHEVWSLSGRSGIQSRTNRMVERAEREVVLVVGDAETFTPELVASLEAARERGVTLLLGAVSTELAGAVGDAFPSVDVFVSGLEWLNAPTSSDDRTTVNRLLLVDRESILVSSVGESPQGHKNGEHAVFGRGFDNGFVAITRRLMVTGLPIGDDPDGPDHGETGV
jgi:sugar-specific transcriptional regulator TrmB